MSWSERRLIVRSVRHAEAAEVALRARVARPRHTSRPSTDADAVAQGALKRCRDATPGGQRHCPASPRRGLRVASIRATTPRHVRCVRISIGQRYVKEDHHATVEVRVDEAALESAVQRLGWRIYSTNQPSADLSLAQAVLAYRSEYQVERSLGRLKGRPLSVAADVCATRRPCHWADLVVIDRLAGVDVVWSSWCVGQLAAAGGRRYRASTLAIAGARNGSADSRTAA